MKYPLPLDVHQQLELPHKRHRRGDTPQVVFVKPCVVSVVIGTRQFAHNRRKPSPDAVSSAQTGMVAVSRRHFFASRALKRAMQKGRWVLRQSSWTRTALLA